MGLEIWIHETQFRPPLGQYLSLQHVLSEAVHTLTSYGMNTSVYNHQLCVINSDVEGRYRKSISDWKNEYLDSCAPCSRRSECGGFFSSSKMYNIVST